MMDYREVLTDRIKHYMMRSNTDMNKGERDWFREGAVAMTAALAEIDALQAQYDAMEARCAALEGALRPFAAIDDIEEYAAQQPEASLLWAEYAAAARALLTPAPAAPAAPEPPDDTRRCEGCERDIPLDEAGGGYDIDDFWFCAECMKAADELTAEHPEWFEQGRPAPTPREIADAKAAPIIAMFEAMGIKVVDCTPAAPEQPCPECGGTQLGGGPHGLCSRCCLPEQPCADKGVQA